MKTKRREIYIGIIFWVFIFMWVISQDEMSFKIDSDVNYPKWLIAIWIVGMWTAIKSLFCINRPAGATKHRKSHYIAYKPVDGVRIKNDIKKQSRKAIRILILWIVFLVVEGLSYYSHIINEKTIVVGMISLRIFDKLFILLRHSSTPLMLPDSGNSIRPWKSRYDLSLHQSIIVGRYFF